jgi:preprotein translocase subunit Sec63
MRNPPEKKPKHLEMSFAAALEAFGFTGNAGYSQEELKKRWRELSLKHHPDRNKGTTRER